MIQELRQETDTFNRKALLTLRILVGLSCIMCALFRLPSLLPSSFSLVSSCSTIFRITRFLHSSLRKNPYFPPLFVSYLARFLCSYTIILRLFFQVSFLTISIHTATTRHYPIDSFTQSLYWPRPYLGVIKYHGRLPFGGHTHL